MKQVRYDVMGADLDYGIRLHPQLDMERLGFKVIHSVPQSIADQWWFTIEDTDIEYPPYIEPMEYDLSYWQ